jgi:hypothetical protein
MVALAISFLWLLIGVVVLAGIIWLVLYGLKTVAGVPVPGRIEQGVWFIFFILILIYALTALSGSGHLAIH